LYETHKAGRNEFELMALGASLLVGGSQVFFAEAPASLSAAMDPAFLTWWAWMLLVGSLVAGIGVAWREVYTGLVLELAGLLALSAAMLAYGLVVMLSSAQAPSLVAVPITVAFGLAALRRSWRVAVKTFRGRERRQGLLKEEVNRAMQQQADIELGGPADNRTDNSEEGE